MTVSYQYFEVLFKIFINTIFASIPEELFLVLFTLAFTGDLCFLKTRIPGQKRVAKDDIGRIAICTVIPAFVSNILRYTGLDFMIIFSVSMISMYILIFIIYDFGNHIKGAVKAAIALMLGMLVTTLIEMSYIPLVLYLTDKTVAYFNNNMYLNIVISLPVRFIQFMIMTFIIIKQYTFVKAKLIKPLFENTALTMITLVTISFNIFFMVFAGNLIGYNKILNGIDTEIRAIITIGGVLFPIINISAVILVIYYKEYQLQALKDELDNLGSFSLCVEPNIPKSTKITYLKKG